MLAQHLSYDVMPTLAQCWDSEVTLGQRQWSEWSPSKSQRRTNVGPTLQFHGAHVG